MPANGGVSIIFTLSEFERIQCHGIAAYSIG